MFVHVCAGVGARNTTILSRLRAMEIKRPVRTLKRARAHSKDDASFLDGRYELFHPRRSEVVISGSAFFHSSTRTTWNWHFSLAVAGQLFTCKSCARIERSVAGAGEGGGGQKKDTRVYFFPSRKSCVRMMKVKREIFVISMIIFQHEHEYDIIQFAIVRKKI